MMLKVMTNDKYKDGAKVHRGRILVWILHLIILNWYD